jgi:hypothetical protein
MRCKFRMETAAAARRSSGVVVEAECDVPFMPIAGMTMAVTHEGDLLKVDEVMWFVDRPDELEVWLVEDVDQDAAYWKRQGWRKQR